MDIKEKPSKTYAYRETSSIVREIITAVAMLILSVATGLWLVYPNLWAMLGPDRAYSSQYLGNLLIYILIMVLFLWMVFRHWHAAKDAADLDSQGIEVQAEILEIWGKETRINQEFWIAYRYYETYEGKTEVRKKYASGLKPGDVVRLRYLERDPHVHRVMLDEILLQFNKKNG